MKKLESQQIFLFDEKDFIDLGEKSKVVLKKLWDKHPELFKYVLDDIYDILNEYFVDLLYFRKEGKLL